MSAFNALASFLSSPLAESETYMYLSQHHFGGLETVCIHPSARISPDQNFYIY